MENKIRLKLETCLSTFTPGILQDSLNLSIILEANGLCFADVGDYLCEKQEKILEDEIIFRQECPMCLGQMTLFAVNTNKGDRTGDKSKSVWTCESCLHQIYNTYDIAKRMKQIRGGL